LRLTCSQRLTDFNERPSAVINFSVITEVCHKSLQVNTGLWIKYARGRRVSFHSDASNLCFCSDLGLGDALPPPHSTFVALRWLRSPPKAKSRKN
jgi:hypothetical protein